MSSSGNKIYRDSTSSYWWAYVGSVLIFSWIALISLSGWLDSDVHNEQKLDCRMYSTYSKFTKCVSDKVKSEDLKGIPSDYLLSMALLETGYGKGNIYKKTNNLFSIKARSWTNSRGPSSYRHYRDDNESIRDVVILLTTRSRYKRVYQFALMDERRKFFRALQESGYSESKTYETDLQRVFVELKREEINKRFDKFALVANNPKHSTTN